MNLTGVSSRPAKTRLAQKRLLQQMDRSATNETSNASIATDSATSSPNAGPKEATKKANARLEETTTIQATIVIATIVIKTAITTAITAITGATGTETTIAITIPIMQTRPTQILKLGPLLRRSRMIPLPLPFLLHRLLTARHSITSLRLRQSSTTREHLDICPLSASDSSIITPSPLVPSPLQISKYFMRSAQAIFK